MENIQEKKEKGINWLEGLGYCGLALTIIGQCVIGISYLCGQGCWLVANGCYLIKAVKQNLGKAEIIRNLCMSAITAGLMIFYWFIH